MRSLIRGALHSELHQLVGVLAGWESGSLGFDLQDEYSDIDLNFLINDEHQVEEVFHAAQSALEGISPVLATHDSPPGRYYRLRDCSEHLLVDICVYTMDDIAERLDPVRHGKIYPLFDKGDYLNADQTSVESVAIQRSQRLQQHREWFTISQSFVRKAIARDRQIEALNAYWGYTLRPLVDLLRIKYHPQRWDFGMRYLEQDLPEAVYAQVRQLIFVGEFDDLNQKLDSAVDWAQRLLRELE